MALAAIPTLKYALTDKEHTRILDELVARRAQAAGNAPEAEADVIEKVEETIEEATDAVEETVEKATETVEETVEEAVEEAAETTDEE